MHTSTFYEALKQKQKWSPVLLKRPEIVGVGVGYANPKKPTLGAAVVIYTKRTLTSTRMTTMKAHITSLFKDVPVRVIPSGLFKSNSYVPSKTIRLPTQFRSGYRPVPGGVSIGHINPPATGTGGLIVVRGGQLYILSNNHVLIKSNSPVYSETLQPGPADGGVTVRDRVGRAFEYIPFNPTGTNYIDAAIALPLSNSILDPLYLTGPSTSIIVPGHLNSFSVGETFIKSGRTTGFVEGVVESVNVDARVNYGGTVGVISFSNQVIILGSRPVSLPGDSGSLWLRQSDHYAAALNFSTTSNGLRSISNPIGPVMSAFGLRVAIPAGGAKVATGAVKGAAPKGKFMYVRPLSRTQLKQIRVLKVRRSK